MLRVLLYIAVIITLYAAPVQAAPPDDPRVQEIEHLLKAKEWRKADDFLHGNTAPRLEEDLKFYDSSDSAFGFLFDCDKCAKEEIENTDKNKVYKCYWWTIRSNEHDYIPKDAPFSKEFWTYLAEQRKIVLDKMSDLEKELGDKRTWP